jgi:hypothetical protein
MAVGREVLRRQLRNTVGVPRRGGNFDRAKYSPRLAYNDQRMEDEIPGRSPARHARGSRAEVA